MAKGKDKGKTTKTTKKKQSKKPSPAMARKMALAALSGRVNRNE
jgi:hypothetical protein